jgi:glycosyltransferase involved in cell wall biosynthesis
LKILFIAPRFHTNQLQIAKTLINVGHKLSFFVYTIGNIEDHSFLTPEILPESIFSKIFKKITKKRKNSQNYFPKLIILYKRLSKLRPDIIIIRRHGRVYTYVAAFFGRMLRSKIVFYDQVNSEFLNHKKDDSFQIKLRRIKLLMLLKLFNAKWITPLKDVSLNYKLPKRCFYIPFVAELKKDYKIEKRNKISLLTISKFQQRKELLLLIECLSKLKNNNFTLTIIGEVSTKEHQDYLEHVNSAIQKNNLSGRIKIIENLPHKNIKNYYQNSDLFILPAKNEPASISIIEALGFGLPVICSDTCGTRTYILPGKNGMVFATGNGDDLYKNIKLYMTNDNILCEQQNWLKRNINNYISSDNYLNSFNKLAKIE